MSKKDFYLLLSVLGICVLILYGNNPHEGLHKGLLEASKISSEVVSTVIPNTVIQPLTPTPSPTVPSLGEIADFSTLLVDISTVTLVENGPISEVPSQVAMGLPQGITTVQTVLFQKGVRRCKYSVTEVAAIVRQVADEFGIPHKVALALWTQESRLSPFIEKDGVCGMIHNTAGAYCAAQIYRPNGAWIVQDGVPRALASTELVHSEYSVDQLQDPYECFRAGARILVGKPGNDWSTKVAYYQGFAGNTNAPAFVEGYLKWYNSGGFYDSQEGVYVSFQ